MWLDALKHTMTGSQKELPAPTAATSAFKEAATSTAALVVVPSGRSTGAKIEELPEKWLKDTHTQFFSLPKKLIIITSKNNKKAPDGAFLNV